MTDEPNLDPLPDAMLDLLDFDRLPMMLGPVLAADPELADEMEAGRLSWSGDGFDEHGMMALQVIHNPSGQVVVTARVHWSNLIPAAVAPA